MMREERNDAGQVIQGTVEMLILKALARGPMHGYGVAEWIEQTSQQVLRVEEGRRIRRCTGLSCVVCSVRSGGLRTTTGGRSSIS